RVLFRSALYIVVRVDAASDPAVSGRQLARRPDAVGGADLLQHRTGGQDTREPARTPCFSRSGGNRRADRAGPDCAGGDESGQRPCPVALGVAGVPATTVTPIAVPPARSQRS